MKICPKCGKENRDSAKFCTVCGSSIENVIAVPGEPAPEPAPAAAPIYAPAPAAPAPVQPKTPMIARSPAQAKLKELAGSKLALIIVIAFTAVVLCSIYFNVFVPASFTNYLKDGLQQLQDADLAGLIGDDLDIDEKDLDDALAQIAGAVEISIGQPVSMARRIISAVSGNAVSILFAVSLWIIYGVAKKEDSVCCGTTGLKIIRVLRTIGLVAAIILAVIFALVLVFGIFMTVREGYDDAATAIYVIAGVTAVIYIFMFWFLGGCISTLKRYISVSENTPGRSRISGFVGVVLFIGGIFSAIGAVSWIAASIANSAGLLPLSVSAAASAVYQFALSRFIGKSKKALKAV